MTASPTKPASPLIGVEELAAILAKPTTLVLDIRSVVDGGGRAAFEVGHIPGAVHTDYVEGGWREKRGGGGGMLPEPGALAALLGRVGLTRDARAIIAPAGVSPGDFAAAARVYWTIKMAGHEAVSILDGGTAAWAAAGKRLEPGAGSSRTAPPYSIGSAAAGRALVSEVKRAVETGSALLLDTRNEPSFVGEEKSPVAARAGRLPGAVHQDSAAAYDRATNRLKPRPELERLFGGERDRTAIAYCNTGQQAATNWFVLSEILGRPDVKLYDGSMSEWTADPARPVENGLPAGR